MLTQVLKLLILLWCFLCHRTKRKTQILIWWSNVDSYSTKVSLDRIILWSINTAALTSKCSCAIKLIKKIISLGRASKNVRRNQKDWNCQCSNIRSDRMVACSLFYFSRAGESHKAETWVNSWSLKQPTFCIFLYVMYLSGLLGELRKLWVFVSWAVFI